MKRWKPNFRLKYLFIVWLVLCSAAVWQRENAARYCNRMMGRPAFLLVETHDHLQHLLKQDRVVLMLGANWSTISQLVELEFTNQAEKSQATGTGIKFSKIEYASTAPVDSGFEPWIMSQAAMSNTN